MDHYIESIQKTSTVKNISDIVFYNLTTDEMSNYDFNLNSSIDQNKD